MSGGLIGVKDHEAPRRLAADVPGQAKDTVPILDKSIEITGAVGNAGHVHEVLPTVGKARPYGKSEPVCLAEDVKPLCAFRVFKQMRGDIERQDCCRLLRRCNAGPEGCGSAVNKVKRIEVHHAQGRGNAAAGFT